MPGTRTTPTGLLGRAAVLARVGVLLGPRRRTGRRNEPCRAFLPGSPASAAVLVDAVPVTAWRVVGTTEAVKVASGVVYVGGNFTRVVAPNGSTRNRRNLAAFDATSGALIEGFQADTNGPVRALAADGNTVWVGGSFTTVRGSGRNRLAAVDAATGALRPFNPNANNIMYAMDVRAGRLFAAGVFSSISGLPRTTPCTASGPIRPAAWSTSPGTSTPSAGPRAAFSRPSAG